MPPRISTPEPASFPAIRAINPISPPALLQKVLATLSLYASREDRLLVAVSGGPDSVALADLLRQLPYPIVIGHVNHQLRKGAAADASFVRSLAKSWDCPYVIEKVNVRVHRRRNAMGVEEAARELRYQKLAGMASRFKCQAVLTAHTANDQSETVLMNFLRGAGPAGLAGIPPVRELTPGLSLIRPFLAVSRTEILSYLKMRRLASRRDPSNQNLRFQRNRIRHETLPYLERLYPGLATRLGQVADIFRDEETYWQARIKREVGKTARKNGEKIEIDLTPLFGYHKTLSRRVLRSLLPGLSFQEIERIFALAKSRDEGRLLFLAGGVRIVKKAQKLVVLQGNS